MIQHNVDLDFSFLSRGIGMPNTAPHSYQDLDILDFVRKNPGLSKQEIAKQFKDYSQFQVINVLMSFAVHGQIKRVNGLYYSDIA